MKVFVSGGAGFIGSHLVKRILVLEELEQVVIFDNFSSGSEIHLADIRNHPKLYVIRGDLKDFDMLSQSMSGIDIVFHFAANPDIAKAVRQPDIDFWEGTYLMQNILESMRINNVKSIFYTSGSGVYGEVPGKSFEESFGPCFPISTYGASKLACEALISSYCHMFSMKGRAVRLANVVGPMQTHGVGYDFVKRLKQEPSVLKILGDGTQSKSYIYVEDVINAILLVIEDMKSSEQPFDIFNVATDDYISVTDIADIACKATGIDPNSVDYQYTGGDRGWKGDVPCVLFNVEKIKSLGWQSTRDSRQALLDSMISMAKELKEVKSA